VASPAALQVKVIRMGEKTRGEYQHDILNYVAARERHRAGEVSDEELLSLRPQTVFKKYAATICATCSFIRFGDASSPTRQRFTFCCDICFMSMLGEPRRISSSRSAFS
jgi:hypothetical protein